MAKDEGYGYNSSFEEGKTKWKLTANIMYGYSKQSHLSASTKLNLKKGNSYTAAYVDKSKKAVTYRPNAPIAGTSKKWGKIKYTSDEPGVGTVEYFIILSEYKSDKKWTSDVAYLENPKKSIVDKIVDGATQQVSVAVETVTNSAASTASTAVEAASGDTGADTGSGTSTGEVIEGILQAAEAFKMSYEDLTDLKTTIFNTETSGTQFFDIRNILGVFGLPYQFLPIADPRIANSQDEQRYGSVDYNQPYGDTRGLGAVFADKIVSSMPILFMSPGKPVFMGEYTKEDRANVLAQLVKNMGNLGNVGTDDLLNNSGRYYTFKQDIDEYYRYVNPMCRIAAALMGVERQKLDNITLDQVNWLSYTTSKLGAIFNGASPQDYLSIPFYIESETQIQDSFNNSTTESTLASTFNSLSDTAREINFLLGNIGAATDSNILKAITEDADISQNADNLNEAVGSLLGGNNFLKNITSHLVSVATGGKLTFPKIWSGSDFSRSYDITIKLRSPDKDNLSLYFNIIVPVMHLIGFVAPHMVQSDPNAFGNPFLVRAIYKGFFNVDMGIITSMNITKGDQGNWNADGVPSTVDVTFTIQDLYETMSITKTNNVNVFKFDTMDNTALMDYIANFCGVNLYEPEIKRNLRMWFVNNFMNRARDVIRIDIWANMKSGVFQRISNVLAWGNR